MKYLDASIIVPIFALRNQGNSAEVQLKPKGYAQRES